MRSMGSLATRAEQIEHFVLAGRSSLAVLRLVSMGPLLVTGRRKRLPLGHLAVGRPR